MFKRVVIFGSLMAFLMLLIYTLPTTAKGSAVVPTSEELLVSVWETGVTDTNLELDVITDQEQIRKELEAIGIDYDKAINDLGKQTKGGSGIEGIGGHWGAMFCTGPRLANDLFLTSPGPYIVGFYGAGWQAIGGCIGGGTCNTFPCLVNAYCSVPSGITAALYTVNAVSTTDLGWGCSP